MTAKIPKRIVKISACYYLSWLCAAKVDSWWFDSSVNYQKKQKIMLYDRKEIYENQDSTTSEDEDGILETNENAKRTKENDKQNRKKAKNELYKAPTNEEMNRLRETENLFNSSLFRMQIDEMLGEINMKQKRINGFEKWLKEFDTFIKDMPEFNDVAISELSIKEKKTKQNKFINSLLENKFDYARTDQDLKLRFIKPVTYHTFGFYKTGCGLKNQPDFNISIVMPSIMFNIKDYLNNRYLARRYYYLLYTATCLKKAKLCKGIMISYLDDNELLPTLLVTVRDNDFIKVQITFVPEDNYFKPDRFYVDKNNLKTSLFKHLDSMECFSEKATTFYNATLLRDVTLNKINAMVEDKLKDVKNIQDGIKLLIVWLTQRNLNSGFVYFQNRYLIYIILYLMKIRKVNNLMSSYQVVRIFWHFVSTTNWNEQPISLCDAKDEDLMPFRQHYAVNVIDYTGKYNLTSFLNLDVYNKMKHEATLALQFLDNNKINPFDALFMVKMPISVQYDAILSLQNTEDFENIKKLTTDEEKFLYSGYYKELIVKKITDVIKQGLHKRIKHIVPYYESREKSFEMGLSRTNEFVKIIFGIALCPESAFSPIEMGPAEYEDEAEAFRTFWGPLCELRRFADNRICEAVYVKCETIQERRQVFKKLLNYIMTKKLDSKYKLAYDEYEDMLAMKNVVLPFKTGTNEEIFQKIRAAFDKLREKVRNTKLQLGVTSVQCSSEMYCFTEPCPSVPTNYKCGKKITTVKGDNIVLKEDVNLAICPQYVAPIECVLQLSRDSKWPNDLQALRAIVTEFYFEIGKLLKEEHNIISKVKEEHLDVLFEGLVFRLRLYQPKEILLLKKYVNDEGLTSYKETAESLYLEKQLNILPSLVSALNGLMLQYPSYGPSTCLVKRWLRSQLIDDFHFPDMAIDLLNASLYLESAPYEISNLPQIAFLRFLKYFAECDFANQAVIINFNDQLSLEELNEMQTDFQKCRTKYPELFIVTPYDGMKSIFTLENPTKILLKRVSVLALETSKYMDSCIMGPGQLHIEELFIPNTQGYSILIHLNPSLISRRHQYIKGNSSIEIESFNEAVESKIPILDFDPVQKYLHTLRKAYNEYALFFYDTYGGPIIAVLWKPSIKSEKEFKVLNSQCQELVDGKLRFNESAAIEDFYIIGRGLVKNIQVL